MSSVLGSERERARAVVAGDLDRLDTLLDDGLVYVHATGVRHDKAQLMAYLRSGPRFLAVDLVEPHVDVMNGGALVMGELHMALQRAPGGDPLEVRSWVSQFWVRHESSHTGWRLRLFQSTRRETSAGASP